MTLRIDEILEQAITAAGDRISEEYAEELRSEMDSACASLAVASIRAGAKNRELAESGYGGSDAGESDCPREVGHPREGLTAGAAWQRGEQ